MTAPKFTPRHAVTGERLSLRLSDRDLAKILAHGRRPGVVGTVTDLNTGTVYRVRTASCGLPHCHCDAVATPMESGR